MISLFQLTIAEDDLKPLEDQYTEALQELRKIVEKEDKTELEKSKLAKKSKNAKRKKNSSLISTDSK